MKNGSKILCALGVVGVVATAVTSSIATRKALTRLKEVKDATGVDPPNRKEAMKLVAKYYIPPMVSIVGTAACIIGAENVNARTIAGATASLALLKKSYDKYGQAVKNVFGIEGDKRVKEEVAHLGERPKETKELYWIGFGYDDYFEAYPSDIERAEYIMNRNLRQGVTTSVSDFFDIVGIEPNAVSGSWGWSAFELLDIMDDGWLTIELNMIDSDTDRPAYAIDFDCKPSEDYEIHQKWYEPDATDRQVPWDSTNKKTSDIPWEK